LDASLEVQQENEPSSGHHLVIELPTEYICLNNLPVEAENFDEGAMLDSSDTEMNNRNPVHRQAKEKKSKNPMVKDAEVQILIDATCHIINARSSVGDGAGFQHNLIAAPCYNARRCG
jgi:hypothetical protein